MNTNNTQFTVKSLVSTILTYDLNDLVETIVEHTHFTQFTIGEILEHEVDDRQFEMVMEMVNNFPERLRQSIKDKGIRKTIESFDIPPFIGMTLVSILSKVTGSFGSVLNELERNVVEEMFKDGFKGSGIEIGVISVGSIEELGELIKSRLRKKKGDCDCPRCTSEKEATEFMDKTDEFLKENGISTSDSSED